MGMVKPGVLWKLKKALYGLRCAPKRWGQERDGVLKEQPVRLGEGKATLEQCNSAKGIWKLILKHEIG